VVGGSVSTSKTTSARCRSGPPRTTASRPGSDRGDGVLGIPPLAGTWFGRATVIDATTIALDGTSVLGHVHERRHGLLSPPVATVSADTSGSVSSSTGLDGVPATNTVTQLVTTLLGVSTGNIEVYFGSDQELNLALAARARLALQSRTPNGPKGAYEYFVLSAAEWAAKLTPPRRLGATITREREFTFPADGTVYAFLANPTGASSPADVDVVDAVMQAWSTPNAVTSKAVSATNRNVAAAVTVWLPGAYATDTTRALFARRSRTTSVDSPIGGVSDPQGKYVNVVPLEGVAGAIFGAADALKFKIQNVAVSLNGKALDLPLVVNVAAAQGRGRDPRAGGAHRDPGGRMSSTSFRDMIKHDVADLAPGRPQRALDVRRRARARPARREALPGRHGGEPDAMRRLGAPDDRRRSARRARRDRAREPVPAATANRARGLAPAGSDWEVLRQALHILLELRPAARTVAARYDRSRLPGDDPRHEVERLRRRRRRGRRAADAHARRARELGLGLGRDLRLDRLVVADLGRDRERRRQRLVRARRRRRGTTQPTAPPGIERRVGAGTSTARQRCRIRSGTRSSRARQRTRTSSR
jgi:hypothetical protein